VGASSSALWRVSIFSTPSRNSSSIFPGCLAFRITCFIVVQAPSKLAPTQPTPLGSLYTRSPLLLLPLHPPGNYVLVSHDLICSYRGVFCISLAVEAESHLPILMALLVRETESTILPSIILKASKSCLRECPIRMMSGLISSHNLALAARYLSAALPLLIASSISASITRLYLVHKLLTLPEGRARFRLDQISFLLYHNFVFL